MVFQQKSDLSPDLAKTSHSNKKIPSHRIREYNTCARENNRRLNSLRDVLPQINPACPQNTDATQEMSLSSSFPAYEHWPSFGSRYKKNNS